MTDIKKVVANLMQFAKPDHPEPRFRYVHFFGDWVTATDGKTFAGFKCDFPDHFKGHSMNESMQKMVLDPTGFGLWFVEPKTGDMKLEPVKATIDDLIFACEHAPDIIDDKPDWADTMTEKEALAYVTMVGVNGLGFMPRPLLRILKMADKDSSVYVVKPPYVQNPGIYISNGKKVLSFAAFKDGDRNVVDWSFIRFYGDIL